MKLAQITSGLWLMFWVVAGWRGGSIITGLAFGGTPVAIIWGFWLMAKHSRKEDGFALDRPYTLKDGTPEKREFTRLVYPPNRRPTLRFGENELEIIDISEKGIRLFNDKQLKLDGSIFGKAVLLSGRSVSVDGEVAWTGHNEVGLLMALIPSSIISEERRVLSGSNRLHRMRLKPKKSDSGRWPQIDAPSVEQSDQTTCFTNDH